MSDKNAKVWSKGDVQSLLVSNDKALVRGLMLIYSKQTPAEQAAAVTKEDNKQGFSAADADILTSFAKFYQRAGFLTMKQLAHARKRVPRYHRQILEDMEANGYQVSYK